MGSVINDGVATTGDSQPVYYNYATSSPILSDLTFSIYGPSGIGEYNPAGTAFVEYFDPVSGGTVVETFAIGGANGASLISIRTGSLYPGAAISDVTITIVDNPNIPGAGPGFKFLGTLGKLMKGLGYIGNSVDGVFGVRGYSVSLLGSEAHEIGFNQTYPAGYLEGLGISPESLPIWLTPAYDTLGNFIGIDFNSCFVAGTKIDMWPDTSHLGSEYNDCNDQRMPIGTNNQKAIEDIQPGDLVLSFDSKGNPKPGRVTRTFRNSAKIILDYFGTGVTPGHVYYRPDSARPHKFETLIDILRDDGVIEMADGTQIRAATGVAIGDPRDDFVWVVTGMASANHQGIEVLDQGRIRLGTRVLTEDGRDLCIYDLIHAQGGRISEHGLIEISGDALPFHWCFGSVLPKPEDYILQRSGTTLADIYRVSEWESLRPIMPLQ